MEEIKDPTTVQELGRILPPLANRFGPQESSSSVTQALKGARDPDTLFWLSQVLLNVAARLEPKDAGQVAAALAQAIKDTKDPNTVSWLAMVLSMVAAGQEPRAGAAALAQALRDTNNPFVLRALAKGLSAVAARLEPGEAAQASSSFVQAMTYAKGPNTVASLAQALSALLSPEPPPCRLSTQQLVELLKTPPCIGEARRVVLDQLGNRYKRRFADAWQFVRFAKEQHLDLDFTTAPQRPEQGGSARAPKR